jgi:hypothetical protein
MIRFLTCSIISPMITASKKIVFANNLSSEGDDDYVILQRIDDASDSQ